MQSVAATSTYEVTVKPSHPDASWAGNVPDWWGGPIAIKHISLSIFANETSLALAMSAGEIDIDLGVGDGKSFAATSGPSAKLLAALSPTYGGMFTMNTHIAPWNDVHVRRAVAYAIDRADIITALGGYALPSYTLIPSQSLSTIAVPGSDRFAPEKLEPLPAQYRKGKAGNGRARLSRWCQRHDDRLDPGRRRHRASDRRRT